MASNIQRIADQLGATIVAELPETGGGAFGAARLAGIVETLRLRLQPGQGERPGRPTVSSWIHHPKIPMSAATQRKLARLADRASRKGRKVSPMQIAAQILEDVIATIEDQ
jgi:hypothetical protein